VVVHFGAETEVLIRMQGTPDEGLADRVYSALKSDGVEVELRRVDFVGPQIGEELRDDGGLGMLLALAIVMLYVAIRFQFKFSVGAVLALAHDVIITLGVFSLSRLEFDLTVLAAVLAVVGYSLNDTIVVSDRIRENFRKIRKASPVEVINESLSQTLWRTINTSATTMLVLLALFFFGGELIHNFSIALMVGVGIGTYSSIYVAATVMLVMNIDREDLLEAVEGELVDDLP
jgi:preprotein translocase subunit SecF